MEELFVAIISMLLVLSLIPLYIWKRRQDSRPPDVHQEDSQVPQRENVVRATATAAGARRMRRRTAAGASSSSSRPAETAVEEALDESDDEEGEHHEARGSRKKEKKRQEREAQRQAEEAARESRQTKQDRYAEMRRRRDEEHEAKERMLEEEANARKAKEEEAAALDFEKWKGSFQLMLKEQQQMKCKTEIRYQKCVPLEDLAAEFSMRTQECINRITSLESMGRLSGVMDDRGKYIYISQEEMKAVADYIKRQGRVSIAHLASKSNQFIDLEPKAQFVEEISNTDEITAA